jgi:hypothetical protein
MESAATYKQVLARLKRLPKDIKNWFDIVPELIERYDWEVSISYVFTRIEVIKHDTLYKGLVKRHWTHAQLTRELLDRDHMDRARFIGLFRIVFDEHIPTNILAHLSTAESIRDRVAHGKRLTPAQARACLMAAFDFMETFNDFVQAKAGFRPFGEGRGFKGRAESLTKETSRWVLRGMGIPHSKKTAE